MPCYYAKGKNPFLPVFSPSFKTAKSCTVCMKLKLNMRQMPKLAGVRAVSLEDMKLCGQLFRCRQGRKEFHLWQGPRSSLQTT